MQKIILIFFTVFTFISCKQDVKQQWFENAINNVHKQLLFQCNNIKDSGKLPRSEWNQQNVDFIAKQLEKDVIIDSLRNISPEKVGHIRYCKSVYDWTSGFFPGALWYAYGLTKDDKLKKYADKYTAIVWPVSNFKGSHDIGFMINCSFGNALKFTSQDSINNVIIRTADNLLSRFNDSIGCIRSWDFGEWNYPVIVDNMMNLELLFNASRISGDNKYKNIAIKHANTTMKNHFRDDYTSFHVVSYNNDGSVEEKCTHQGKNDNSAWSRGQAWGLYGYTVCYRETQDKKYLNQAVNIANIIMQKNKTADKVPYWDYDAPTDKNTPRDASAAAINASALIELSGYVENGNKYLKYAEEILKSLSSPDYLSKTGSNNGFILMHSVGSLPHGSEIDVPINYADYYYLEALYRYKNLKK